MIIFPLATPLMTFLSMEPLLFEIVDQDIWALESWIIARVLIFSKSLANFLGVFYSVPDSESWFLSKYKHF